MAVYSRNDICHQVDQLLNRIARMKKDTEGHFEYSNFVATSDALEDALAPFASAEMQKVIYVDVEVRRMAKEVRRK
jgi:hypothetical protein